MGSISVYEQMKEILDEIDKDVDLSVKTNLQEVAKEAAQKLKGTSPKRTGAYAGGWTTRRMGEMEVVTCNSAKPGLTHLLENGHVIRNKKGTYGRVRAIKHIKPVEEWAIEELPRRIIEDIL